MDLISSQILSHSVGQKAVMASGFCAVSSLFLIYSVSVTRSLVITGAAWTAVFSFFCLISTIISLSNTAYTSSKRHTFGFARAPVLAVFSTTVLAQLSSVFLIKEAVERLFEVGHHHGGSAASNNYFYAAAFANGFSLLAAAYAVTNQPFNYVLMAAQSSVIQEHAADISRAVCHLVPGLARVLLPRLNSLALLASISTACCALTHFFMNDFWWFDSVAALALSAAVFSTMMPLSTYTGRILLQTTPPHIHNQIDRCISEASTVEGVLELRNAHFWQLDFNSIAGTIDVRIRRDANEQIVLGLVTEKLSTIVSNVTVQVLKDITTTWGSSSSMASGYGTAPAPAYYASDQHNPFGNPMATGGIGGNSSHSNLMSPHVSFHHQHNTPTAALQPAVMMGNNDASWSRPAQNDMSGQHNHHDHHHGGHGHSHDGGHGHSHH